MNDDECRVTTIENNLIDDELDPPAAMMFGSRHWHRREDSQRNHPICVVIAIARLEIKKPQSA